MLVEELKEVEYADVNTGPKVQYKILLKCRM